ncbi:BCCT family transporter [Halomicrococcus sp. NG-SE-24]|uniref:BCCT family transporter n=1 Tax=Halomicrococcus sp. NG-SE-24 TaxID=3436928 RepID=UPI003D96BE70
MSTSDDSQLAQLREEIHPGVFGGGVLLTLLLIAFIGLTPDLAASTLSDANDFIITKLGWLYMWIVFAAVLFCGWLMFSSWGRIKLGDPDEEPEFTLMEFFAMMFSSGLAVGLVFWGPAEALAHFQSGPPFFEAGAKSQALMPGAIQYTLFHSGISPWAAYLVFGVVFGYFAHRRDYALRPATIFAPFVNDDSLDSWWATLVDAAVVVISVGGICVSLGFGVIQFTTGLQYNWGINLDDTGIVLLTIGLTIAFTASAAVGVQRGIRRISDFNILLFAVLLVTALIFAPISYVLNLGSQAFAGLITDFVGMSFYTNFANDAKWVGGWTMFFWAWWLAFGPMIGIFIARICRGRTIRQVVFVGIIGTSAASFPWFITLGGSALWAQTTGKADLLKVMSNFGIEGVGFSLFEQLIPFSGVFSALYLLLVLTFLITTVDSSTLSVAMLTVGGDEHPTVLNRVVWGVLVGLLTSLLIIIGGLSTLQSFVVLVGFPTALMCVVCMVGLVLTLERRTPVLLTESEPTEAETSQDFTQRSHSQTTTED